MLTPRKIKSWRSRLSFWGNQNLMLKIMSFFDVEKTFYAPIIFFSSSKLFTTSM